LLKIRFLEKRLEALFVRVVKVYLALLLLAHEEENTNASDREKDPTCELDEVVCSQNEQRCRNFEIIGPCLLA